MDPRLHYEPIIEPIEAYIPHELPPAQNYEAYEFSFPREQRMWIRERDGGYSNFPLYNSKREFIGFDRTLETVHVHHITPQHYYKANFDEETALYYMHNPLNGISLDPTSHNIIHRDWMCQYKDEYLAMPEEYKRYASLEDYVRWQADQGRPTWLTTYDGVFALISTIRTVRFAEVSNKFPFPEDYLDLAMFWYTKAKNNKKDRELVEAVEREVDCDYL